LGERSLGLRELERYKDRELERRNLKWADAECANPEAPEDALKNLRYTAVEAILRGLKEAGQTEAPSPRSTAPSISTPAPVRLPDGARRGAALGNAFAEFDRQIVLMQGKHEADAKALEALRDCIATAANGEPMSPLDKRRVEKLAEAAERAEPCTEQRRQAVDAYFQATRSLMCKHPEELEFVAGRARLSMKWHRHREAWDAGRVLAAMNAENAEGNPGVLDSIIALQDAGLNTWSATESTRNYGRTVGLQLLDKAAELVPQIQLALASVHGLNGQQEYLQVHYPSGWHAACNRIAFLYTSMQDSRRGLEWAVRCAQVEQVGTVRGKICRQMFKTVVDQKAQELGTIDGYGKFDAASLEQLLLRNPTHPDEQVAALSELALIHARTHNRESSLRLIGESLRLQLISANQTPADDAAVPLSTTDLAIVLLSNDNVDGGLNKILHDAMLLWRQVLIDNKQLPQDFYLHVRALEAAHRETSVDNIVKLAVSASKPTWSALEAVALYGPPRVAEQLVENANFVAAMDDDSIVEVAYRLLRDNYDDGAKKLAAHVKADAPRDRFRRRLAQHFAKKRRFGEAVAIAGSIEDPLRRASAQALIALEQSAGDKTGSGLAGTQNNMFAYLRASKTENKKYVSRDDVVVACLWLAEAYMKHNENNHVDEVVRNAAQVLDVDDVNYLQLEVAKVAAHGGKYSLAESLYPLLGDGYRLPWQAEREGHVSALRFFCGDATDVLQANLCNAEANMDHVRRMVAMAEVLLLGAPDFSENWIWAQPEH